METFKRKKRELRKPKCLEDSVENAENRENHEVNREHIKM